MEEFRMEEPKDQSHLDEKYFIDTYKYNCPFCNRRHVSYHVQSKREFAWSREKHCYVYFVQCDSCDGRSMHLSYDDIAIHEIGPAWRFTDKDDLDSRFFYSVPTSFLVLDHRIPSVIRELISEADGSRKMNFLTGASACARKAIYEFLVREKAEGESYEDQIKWLKKRFREVDGALFDVLGHIQGMTSEKVHEQSWPKWDSKHLALIIEILKAVLHEVYVVPEERAQRLGKILELLKGVRGKTPVSDNPASE